jgi:hypothetical protein
VSLVRAKLPLSFDTEHLAADAARFQGAEWQPHFNRHYYEGSWSVVPLRAVKDGKLEIFPDIEAPEGYFDTPLMSRCRYVPEVLAAFKCELQTVRFLKLAAGSVIRRHRDYALGLEDGFVRVHVPALTNDGVNFVLNDEIVPLKAGEAWYLNVNNYHSVTNEGTTDRIHLVIDCVVNDWVREMLAQAG